MSATISFEDFSKIDIRVGTIIEVNDFPEAHKPAFQLSIDFGDLGIKNTSAQITTLYSKEDLLDKQIVANVNFKKKQIANFMSECLIIGAVDSEKVILLSPEDKVPNGTPVR
jgi:tRNA-binding protein